MLPDSQLDATLIHFGGSSFQSQTDVRFTAPPPPTLEPWGRIPARRYEVTHNGESLWD
jgi:hypothetical protein